MPDAPIDANTPPRRLDSDAGWEAVSEETPRFSSLRDRLFRPWLGVMAGAGIRLALSERLAAGFSEAVVLRVQLNDDKPVFALVGPTFIRYLEGSAPDLFSVGLRDTPKRLDSAEGARDYLRLFLDIARGSEGWRLAEYPEDLEWDSEPSAADISAAHAILQPITLAGPDGHGRWRATATIQRAGCLVRWPLRVWPDGFVHIGTEEEVIRLPLLAPPTPFRPFSALRHGTLAGLSPSEGVGAACLLEGTLDENEMTLSKPPPAPKIADVFRLLAAQLLDAAVRVGFRPQSRGSDPALAFIQYLKTYRPTLAIETPYRELRQELAQIIAERCEMLLDGSWQAGPSEGPRGQLTTRPDASVVLLTEASFGTQADGTERDAGLVLAPIVHGPHIGLFVVERIGALQQNARDMIDLRLSIPRLDESQFWAATRSLFGNQVRRRPGARDWVGYVLPRDFARAAAAAGDLHAFLRELEETISRRLAQYTDPSGPSLTDLHGMGEARYRMEELAADIAAAQKGEIGWDQVDRGYLLVGPPGTGKTTLVRALARACGIRFVLASASAWQEGGSLGPHVQNIRRTFREARLYAPAILFIDEIDGIGSRGKTEAHNSQYQTVVINTVLEEMHGFEGREGVIVIGATNNPEDVDPALRRPGRLDRIIELGYPNVAALAEIYSYYLARAARDGFRSDGVDTMHLARMTFGRTGSHVELYVRGAVRLARRAGRRTVTQADLLAEITGRPPEGLMVRLADGIMRRVAVHEAGHVLMTLTGPDGADRIAWASITPRADGSLGFVARSPDDQAFSTHAEMEESTRITLAGRAAEELVFGREAVSTGAGGGGKSDLAAASRMVMRMLTQFGFSEASGLLWLDWRGDDRSPDITAEAIRNLPLGDELLHEARRTLDRLYGQTIERLRSHRPALERIADLLIEKQDLSATELKAAMS